MGPKVELRLGMLKGEGVEIECFVGIPVGDYAHNSRPSIQNAPPNLPDGEYVFTSVNGSIPFKRYQGMWLPIDS